MTDLIVGSAPKTPKRKPSPKAKLGTDDRTVDSCKARFPITGFFPVPTYFGPKLTQEAHRQAGHAAWNGVQVQMEKLKGWCRADRKLVYDQLRETALKNAPWFAIFEAQRPSLLGHHDEVQPPEPEIPYGPTGLDSY